MGHVKVSIYCVYHGPGTINMRHGSWAPSAGPVDVMRRRPAINPSILPATGLSNPLLAPAMFLVRLRLSAATCRSLLALCSAHTPTLSTAREHGPASALQSS